VVGEAVPHPGAAAPATGAAADFTTRSILADPRFLSAVYKDPQHSRVWSSCMLVHEAVHLKENTRREDIPNVFAYMCLDRLGAPGWMKDYLYGLIERDLRAAADCQAATAAAAAAAD